MSTPLDQVRCCLHVGQWPENDQNLWHKITAPRHVLDEDGGHSASWRTPTRVKNRKSYGRWLSYLVANGDLDVNELPTDRITRDRLKGYVLMLQKQVAPWTVWSYVTCLEQIAMSFAPEENWSWLKKVAAKLKVRRVPTRSKLARMQTASEIAAWAYQRLDALNGDSDRRPMTVLQYRDALFIAILINCPMRLRNLAIIRIGQHLVRADDVYRLDFVPSEVKTDRYLTLHLPLVLSTYIDAWIDDWRAYLLKKSSIDALWLGIRGAPMHEGGIYWRIKNTTEAAFGVSINPHLFRDIAVTTIADEMPENIGITAPLLGHINQKTTEEHYIHANQLRACRRYATSISSLRQSLAKEYQGQYKPQGDD
jgi:integrase/recombinase XerD